MTALRLAFVLDATTKIEGKKLKGEIWERTVLRHVLAKVCMNVYLSKYFWDISFLCTLNNSSLILNPTWFRLKENSIFRPANCEPQKSWDFFFCLCHLLTLKPKRIWKCYFFYYFRSNTYLKRFFIKINKHPKIWNTIPQFLYEIFKIWKTCNSF